MRLLILIGLGCLIGMAMGAFPAFQYGKMEGRKLERGEIMERSVAAGNNRRKVDAKISSSIDSKLCYSLGLRPNEVNECLRRLGKVKP